MHDPADARQVGLAEHRDAQARSTPHDARPGGPRLGGRHRHRASRRWCSTSASTSESLKRRCPPAVRRQGSLDRKCTRLNSSHVSISYAVFCLKKKNKKNKMILLLCLHLLPLSL